MSSSLRQFDQITMLQRKIQLLEGERTAFYESTQCSMKKNRETIRKLRDESKLLYRKLAEAKVGDEHVIKVAFEDRGSEKEAFRNMTVKEVITTLDQSVQAKKKHLNAIKHTTQTLESRGDELQKEYRRRRRVSSDRAEAHPADAHAGKREEDATTVRDLENRLEKIQLKCKEAENITATYLELKGQMQDESLTYQGQLDSLEADIQKHREELQHTEAMYKNAQLSKDAAKAELQQQEEMLYKERKERERIIATYRKVEENKIQNSKMMQTVTVEPNDLRSEPQRSITRMTDEEEKRPSAYEEAYQRMKDNAGVTRVQELEERFASQKETRENLESMRSANEKVLLELKEQESLLDKEFQDMKYSGEAKRLGVQRVQEERKQLLNAAQQRCDAFKERLDDLRKTISTVRAGVEHLADKLQHITASEEDTVSQVSPDPEEDIVELLRQCQLKIKLLDKELEGKDLPAVMKEIRDDEFCTRIEGKLPAYNIRVKLPEDQNLDLVGEGDDSDDDEAAIISREALKRQSQLIVESQSKKKAWKKKKGDI